MARNTQLSDSSSNAACNAVGALCNSGTLSIYAGVQPANGNTAISGQLLVQIALQAPAFSPAVGGVANLNPTSPATAVATGTASFFRIASLLGSPLWDGSVGTSGCNLNLASVNIAIGQPIQVSGFFIAIGEGGN